MTGSDRLPRGLSTARAALTVVLAALACAAIASHGAGHVSMDSSAQLYEALTGRSVSWSPPLMSAVLRWFGGGTSATTAFVVLCAVLTYGGFAFALSGAGRADPVGTGTGVVGRVVGISLILLAMLNPLVFFHVGIVWKDVLFASFVVFGAGLLLHATRRGFSAAARLIYILAAAALVPAVLVRQQGIVLVPPLLLACAIGAAGPWRSMRDTRGWLRTGCWLAVFAVATMGLHAASQATIAGSDDKSTSTGFASIRKYDITGMVAAGYESPGLPASLRTAEFNDAVRRTYSDDRIDYVMAEPMVVASLKYLPDDEVKRIWWSLVRAHPDAYAAMKARQLAWLFGLRRLDRCLPIHVGVEGNADYLRAAHVPRGMDGHDRAIYQWSLKARHLVLYRHWFYLAMLVVAAAWLLLSRRRLAPAEQVATGSLVVGLALFYASFSVTVLACDVRYLYPGLAGVTTLWIYLLSRRFLGMRGSA
jgi:hypothetical protein